MTHKILIPLLALLLTSCGNGQQKKATAVAKQIQAEFEENTPGTIATSATGFMMKAKIGGRAWVANTMLPPDDMARIVGYYHDESIGLPYDKRSFIVGNKIDFREDYAVDLFTDDDIGMWGGYTGQMEITKVDGNWVEGSFYFTGSTFGSKETIEVTNGFFRVSFRE